jgi:ParB family chromosome partitioning protein
MMSALSVDKAELAKLLSVAHEVPTAVVQAIGPAPKAGRPRWLAFASLVNSGGGQKKIQKLITSDAFGALSSDRRFETVFATLSEEKPDRSVQHWEDPTGRKVVKIERSIVQTKLFFDERLAANFGTYVTDNLARLYGEFQARSDEQ